MKNVAALLVAAMVAAGRAALQGAQQSGPTAGGIEPLGTGSL